MTTVSAVPSYDSAFEEAVANRYTQQGYDVKVHPEQGDLPFDLGNYQPDLIAQKSSGEGLVIEVKGNVNQLPVDRFRDIAEMVAQQKGWRFLLVTGEDVSTTEQPLTYEQIKQSRLQAERLLSFGATDGAFLSSWMALEALLRRQAERAAIPVERRGTQSLFKHLYSQGELSLAQYNTAMRLQEIRNRAVHGYQTDSLPEETRQLLDLIDELFADWNI